MYNEKMKKRRLTAIFSVALVIVLVIVLFYTVLVLRSVQIVFLNTKSEIITTPEKFSGIDIENTFGDFYGKPMLFLDKNSMKAKAQAIDVYIKVVDIVKEFPNKAVLYFAERTEVFSFSYNGKKYCMDNEGIILREIPANQYRIDISNSLMQYVVGESVHVGGTLKFSDAQSWKLGIILFVSEYLWSIHYDYEDIRQVINLVEIVETAEEARLIIGEANCLEFVIMDPKVRLDEKLECAFSAYLSLEDKSEKQLFVEVKLNGTIECRQSDLTSSNFS